MSAKKIAIVRARYNPFGGAERFVARALHALDQSGIELTIIARRWQGHAQEAGSAHRVILNPIHLGRVWRDASFACAVKHHVARHDYDLVQSHERIPGLDIYRAGDGVHREWLAQRSQTLNRWQRLGLACNPYHAYVQWQETRMFAHPALRAVICNSHMVKQEIHEWFGVPESKLHVIYNGVDTAKFHPQVKQGRSATRAQWRVPETAFCFLFLGSGFERKGLASCIEALAELPQACLMVVGHDKHQARYQTLAQSCGVAGRVVFAGAQQDVLPFYGMADAFVLPTLYDPFPNAVLEAMACGLPVITSTKSGVAELISNGQQGEVVPPNQPASLAQAMRALMQSGRADAMGAAARKLAEHHDLTRLGQQLSDLYRQLLV
ncbi:MAG: glycosyltransferase family 1 protein [Burkholderiaceae bacterium]|nr:MAG: glycosyltransferase family 1 protein [Burkholderiaceae bacterium]